MKKRGYSRPLTGFVPVHMPHNTGMGVVLAGLATVLGFALIWHIWWLVVVAFVTLIGTAIAHTFNYNRDYYIPAAEVAAIEDNRTRLLAGKVTS